MPHFMDAIETLRPQIYRAKGFVPTPGGMMHVDVSMAAATMTADAPPHAQSGLVCIGRRDSYEALAALAEDAKKGSFSAN
jgi:G3E family GTPase